MQNASSKLGLTFVLPTEGEDEALLKIIQEDGEDFEASKAWFDRAHLGHPKTRGQNVGIASAQNKVAFSLRVEPELLDSCFWPGLAIQGGNDSKERIPEHLTHQTPSSL